MEQTVRRRGKQKAESEIRELRSVIRLAVCLVIFLVVFLGRGVFPVQTRGWRQELLDLIRQDTDFRPVLIGLGEAVGGNSDFGKLAEDVFIQVLGAEEVRLMQPDRAAAVYLRMESEEMQVFSKPTLARQAVLPEEVPPAVRVKEEPPMTPVQEELGLSESVTPVMGVLTSGYGMRLHPIDRETKMHDGIDIAADTGTDILAFADGTVDYIGESKAYGMYLQLRHANGITTFYAHCSKLCVQKGQKVKMGDVVAKVGNTGVSTGPHLHLEMKKNGTRIDPQPYVEYLLG